uniref:Uncharacterized protein n=1 Tax=Arundo donax TaxID=35708 RepID=A0A0A9HCQ7_ARUDO
MIFPPAFLDSSSWNDNQVIPRFPVNFICIFPPFLFPKILFTLF